MRHSRDDIGTRGRITVTFMATVGNFGATLFKDVTTLQRYIKSVFGMFWLSCYGEVFILQTFLDPILQSPA